MRVISAVLDMEEQRAIKMLTDITAVLAANVLADLGLMSRRKADAVSLALHGALAVQLDGELTGELEKEFYRLMYVLADGEDA